MPKETDLGPAATPRIVRKAKLLIANECGLHIRAAAMLVRLAESIDAHLTIECGQQRVNGKSIMSLLTLGAAKGMVVQAVAEGAEAPQMIQALKELFADGFYEKAESETQASSGPMPPGNGSAQSMEGTVIRDILDHVAVPTASPATAPAKHAAPRRPPLNGNPAPTRSP